MMKAADIQERFLSPCCWRENLARHNSPEAAELRREIEALVKAGMTEEAVVDRYVKKYGERILREPRGSRQVYLLITPIVVLFLGLLWVIYWLRTARARTIAADMSRLT